MEELESPCNRPDLQNVTHGGFIAFSDDFDSACSIPYVSAPSSPGHGLQYAGGGGGIFYSAPASPVHFVLSSSCSSNLNASNSASSSSTPLEGAGGSFEFEAAHGPAPSGSMSSADELFLNGQIRPMKLSSHLQRPQAPAPLLDVGETDGDDEDKLGRCRDLKFRDRSKSLRRRARSMSPLRSNNAFQWLKEFEDERESTEIKEILEREDEQKADDEGHERETQPSGASSRSSSVGRSSKRWVFLKEFLYRSKSEGRSSTSSNGNHKFWSSLTFSPSTNKDRKSSVTSQVKSKTATTNAADGSATAEGRPKTTTKKAVNGVGDNRKRRVVRSAHELHYTTNRAQAEELRKRTYLPYREGLLGFLGFSSKSYGAMNGFARALNPVSSR